MSLLFVIRRGLMGVGIGRRPAFSHARNTRVARAPIARSNRCRELIFPLESIGFSLFCAEQTEMVYATEAATVLSKLVECLNCVYSNQKPDQIPMGRKEPRGSPVILVHGQQQKRQHQSNMEYGETLVQQ